MYDIAKGPYGMANGGAIKERAAGILFLSPDDKVFLMRRTSKKYAGTWALPAGGIEKGETPEEAARRETMEEAGFKYNGSLKPFMHTAREGVDFTTFEARTQEFQPELNDEHDGSVWIKPAEAIKDLPLHPGVKAALERLRSRKASGGASAGVPIVAAGGEHVLTPDQVRDVGAGDLDRGHRVLDKWVLKMRAELIKTLKNLKPPRKD